MVISPNTYACIAGEGGGSAEKRNRQKIFIEDSCCIICSPFLCVRMESLRVGVSVVLLFCGGISLFAIAEIASIQITIGENSLWSKKFYESAVRRV